MHYESMIGLNTFKGNNFHAYSLFLHSKTLLKLQVYYYQGLKAYYLSNLPHKTFVSE